ncbi:MAG: hypothetical protein WD638_10235, partial [Nitriliruptoraceae bacterium]
MAGTLHRGTRWRDRRALGALVAVSVVEPFASGIGGGGAALIAAPGTEPIAYDYREGTSTAAGWPGTAPTSPSSTRTA